MTTHDTAAKWLYAEVEQAAERFPDHAALEWEAPGSPRNQLGYRQLLARSRAVAEAIRTSTPTNPERVAILAYPGPDTFVAYLGALAAGATAVPVDPHWPQTRIARILELAGLRVAVTAQQPLEPPLSGWNTVADAHGVRVLALGLDARVRTADDAEYILFTSGTTGDPKGVPIGSPQVAAFIRRARDRYEINDQSRLSQNFALTFDPSIFDMFCTWSAGACLCLPNPREASLVSRYVTRARLTHWFGVPSALTVAGQLGMLEPDSMPELETAMVCGEPFHLAQAESLLRAAPRASVWNLYGPTELTIACTDYHVDRNNPRWRSTANGTVPIGTLFERHEQVLTDAAASATSTRGELCVRGPQRFGGYLVSSEDTGRFWPPATADAATEDNYYRTGDVVSEHDGLLVHIGRGDRQVQVGGFRVELGEVEAALRSCGGVLEAVVYPSETDRVVSLSAVCVSTTASSEGITRQLRTLVPSYMVPRRILVRSDAPTSPHGKLDRAALQRQGETSPP